MTIKEASEKWKISENTILKYLLQGYLFDLKIINNVIIIPDIQKPYIKKVKDNNIRAIDENIIAALEKNNYTNYVIMNIEPKLFIERIKVLEKDKKIYSSVTNPNYEETKDFVLSSEVGNNKTFNLHISPKLNITSQVGLVNVNKN